MCGRRRPHLCLNILTRLDHDSVVLIQDEIDRDAFRGDPGNAKAYSRCIRRLEIYKSLEQRHVKSFAAKIRPVRTLSMPKMIPEPDHGLEGLREVSSLCLGSVSVHGSVHKVVMSDGTTILYNSSAVQILPRPFEPVPLHADSEGKIMAHVTEIGYLMMVLAKDEASGRLKEKKLNVSVPPDPMCPHDLEWDRDIRFTYHVFRGGAYKVVQFTYGLGIFGLSLADLPPVPTWGDDDAHLSITYPKVHRQSLHDPGTLSYPYIYYNDSDIAKPVVSEKGKVAVHHRAGDTKMAVSVFSIATGRRLGRVDHNQNNSLGFLDSQLEEKSRVASMNLVEEDYLVLSERDRDLLLKGNWFTIYVYHWPTGKRLWETASGHLPIPVTHGLKDRGYVALSRQNEDVACIRLLDVKTGRPMVNFPNIPRYRLPHMWHASAKSIRLVSPNAITLSVDHGSRIEMFGV